MRKNIIYILAAMPLLAGCLMEYPEMTADGELGIDPTSVTVNLEISADLKLREEIPDYSDEDEVWMHRITVAAYDAGTRLLEKKETIYEELTSDGELSVDLDMKLHAKEYRIVVWADLESEGESGAYYGVGDLTSILYAENNYRGQTIYKDALYASVRCDLSKYRDEWGAEETVSAVLSRSMGVYELVANDVQRFLSKLEAGEVAGETFTARVNYDGFLPAGFNAYDGITKHAFRYLTFRRTVRVPDSGAEELSLVFDYVFMDDEEDTIPLTLDILDEKGIIIASTSLNVACRKNGKTVIRRPFLTSMPGDGVGIDTGFEESEDIDLGII